MRSDTLSALPTKLTALALAAISLSSGSAKALDWRIIQDQLGAQASPMVYWPSDSAPIFRSFQFKVPAGQVYAQGKVLFAEDFEGGALGDYPGHPGVTLIKDPCGKGICARVSTSEYRLKDLPVPPGHWIVLGWKARTVSGEQRAFLEAGYRDAEGKPLGKPARKHASSGAPGADWEEQLWSLSPSWSSHLTMMPPDTRSISLRFFHDGDDRTVTLIDDIRVVDIQPVVLQVVADTIGAHQRSLATAVERISAVPDSPQAKLWKEVVATHGDRIAAQLEKLAQQDPTSEEFIRGSDPPLLFARRLADAAEALETGLAHPATILTYQTRPFPVNGPFYHHHRLDPAGVRPYASQIEGELANQASIAVCRGEYEPVSIALWSPRDLDQVVAKASDLKGPTGSIPASSMDIKVVKCWYQRGERSGRWLALVPRFLLNDDALVRVDLRERRHDLKLSFPEGGRYVAAPAYAELWSPSDAVEPVEEDLEAFPLRDSDSLRPFDLVGGQNKQLWVTVKVPDDAVAGQYSGDIIFRADEREIARFELNLQVLPFSLPAPKTRYDLSQDYTFSIYYRGLLAADGQGKVGNRDKSEAQFRAELRLMYEHGIVAPLMVLSGHWPTGATAFLRSHLEIMREVGMAGRPLYLGENVERAPDQLDTLRRAVTKTVAVAREYGFTDVYFYGQDEASGEMLRTKQLPSWRAVHEGGGKVQVSVTYHSLGDVPDELDLVIAAQMPQRHLAPARHRLGHKIHSYSFPFTNHHDPLIYRRNCGLVTWSHDYDGVTPYCFMHSQGGVWNDLDGPDFNIAYPTVDGAVSTLALEALREGADDIRYATLLMTRIEDIRQNGTTEAKALAAKASQWLEAVDFLVADLDLARTKMIDYISTLTRQ